MTVPAQVAGVRCGLKLSEGNMSRGVLTIVIAALCAARFCGVSSAAVQYYRVIDLGTLGDAPATPGTPPAYGFAINANNHVAGASNWSTSDPFQHAFVHNGTNMIDLNIGDESQAFAVNLAGHVAGFATFAGYQHAFWYDGTTTHDLGTMGGISAEASAMNNSDVIVGSYDFDVIGGTTNAYRYDHGTITTLPNLGTTYTRAYGINNAGTIVGGGDAADGFTHAFVYDGAMHDLGTFGGDHADAEAINTQGDIIGTYGDSTAGWQGAYLYRNGVLTDLGSLGGDTITDGINDDDIVVGQGFGPGNAYSHGFVYDPTMTGIKDLNDILTLDSQGWVIEAAGGINNGGYIAASGHFGADGTHALLLEPSALVPEPAGGLLVLAAAAMLARRPSRRQRGHDHHRSHVRADGN
jgi:probable HAF family extracellular repeat protein